MLKLSRSIPFFLLFATTMSLSTTEIAKADNINYGKFIFIGVGSLGGVGLFDSMSQSVSNITNHEKECTNPGAKPLFCGVGVTNSQPQWSPFDGNVYFLSSIRATPNEGMSIYKIKPDGTALTKIQTKNVTLDAMSLSQDGTKLLYTYGKYSETELGEIRIKDLKTDIDNLLPLPPTIYYPGNITEPTLSADGKYVAFICTSIVKPEGTWEIGVSDICRIDVDGRNFRKLTNYYPIYKSQFNKEVRAIFSLNSLKISPDNNSIAFIKNEFLNFPKGSKPCYSSEYLNLKSEIFKVEIPSKKVVKLVKYSPKIYQGPNPEYNCSYSEKIENLNWSVDGKFLSFLTNQRTPVALNPKNASESANIAVLNLKELKRTQITNYENSKFSQLNWISNSFQTANADNTKITTITCIKGQLTKKVTAVKPKCPDGYKLKK